MIKTWEELKQLEQELGMDNNIDDRFSSAWTQYLDALYDRYEHDANWLDAFDSGGSDETYGEHHGKRFEVLRRVSVDDPDYTGNVMWWIKLESSEEVPAYLSEVYDYDKCV